MRLTQHGRFGFNPANAPAENRKAVDHCCVAVGANEGIGIGDGLAVRHFVGPNGLRQIFEIDLVADASARRHDAEILKRALTPF